MVKPMDETTRLRFGILGCGSASIPVGEAITASLRTELAAVYDINPEMSDDLSRRFHAQKMESLEALLASRTVDAVYVAVPHYLLAPLTARVLESGKHALTEKPLAISLAEVDRLTALATERNLGLGVFYEMRYASAHAKARELIQAGALGEIIGIQIQTLIDKRGTYWQSGYSGRSINPWRGIKSQAGGGVVLMNTSHLLDALFHITGLTVASVSAEIGTFVGHVEVEDTACATLRFNNGAVGSLFAGAHIPGARNEENCDIYGKQGRIRLPDPYGNDPLRIYLKRPWRDFKAEEWHSVSTESAPVYQLAVEAFAKAVQSNECIDVSAKDARRVLAVVLAIYQSAAEKRAIIVS